MRISFRNLVLFGALVAGIAACGGLTGTTPNCTPNVDGSGIHASKDGCEQFAYCDKGDPVKCCVDEAGDPLTGNDLATCMFGYGAGPAPTGTGGSGGGGGSGGSTATP